MSYDKHPDLITPPDDTVLWRYCDFARFVQMLEARTLWFARPDTFDDPLEGTPTDGELAHFQSLANVGPVDQRSVSDSYVQISRLTQKSMFVNCWRAGSEESMAMWDLYGKGSGIVAVKSTVGQLKHAASNYNKTVYIAQVKYIDWSEAPFDNNILVYYSRKDLSYKHESEVRAIIWEHRYLFQSTDQLLPDGPHAQKETYTSSNQELPTGLDMPFDPNSFITEVIVGPREPFWVINLVQRVAEKYGLPHQVLSSNRLKPRY